MKYDEDKVDLSLLPVEALRPSLKFLNLVLKSMVRSIGLTMVRTLNGAGLLVVCSVIYMHGLNAKTQTQTQDLTTYHMQQVSY